MELANFLFSNDIFRIITKLGRKAQFAQISFASFLFPLRVTSETIQLRRDFRDDRICDFIPQSGKILVGVRGCNNIPSLVMKFSYMENLPGGCILRRFCTCGESLSRPRGFAPPSYLAYHRRTHGSGGPTLS